MTETSGSGNGESVSKTDAMRFVSFITQALVWPLVVIVWDLTVNQATIQKTRYTAEDGRAAIVEQVKFVTERIASNADAQSTRMENLSSRVGDDTGRLRQALQDMQERLRAAERAAATIEMIDSRLSAVEQK